MSAYSDKRVSLRRDDYYKALSFIDDVAQWIEDDLPEEHKQLVEAIRLLTPGPDPIEQAQAA